MLFFGNKSDDRAFNPQIERYSKWQFLSMEEWAVHSQTENFGSSQTINIGRLISNYE